MQADVLRNVRGRVQGLAFEMERLGIGKVGDRAFTWFLFPILHSLWPDSALWLCCRTYSFVGKRDPQTRIY